MPLARRSRRRSWRNAQPAPSALEHRTGRVRRPRRVQVHDSGEACHSGRGCGEVVRVVVAMSPATSRFAGLALVENGVRTHPQLVPSLDWQTPDALRFRSDVAPDQPTAEEVAKGIYGPPRRRNHRARHRAHRRREDQQLGTEGSRWIIRVPDIGDVRPSSRARSEMAKAGRTL